MLSYDEWFKIYRVQNFVKFILDQPVHVWSRHERPYTIRLETKLQQSVLFVKIYICDL